MRLPLWLRHRPPSPPPEVTVSIFGCRAQASNRLRLWKSEGFPLPSARRFLSHINFLALPLPRIIDIGKSTSHREDPNCFHQEWDDNVAGGNGSPLQYSFLENPMDRGVWWATVHGVTKSQTWLSKHTQDDKHHSYQKVQSQYEGFHIILGGSFPKAGVSWFNHVGHILMWSGIFKKMFCDHFIPIRMAVIKNTRDIDSPGGTVGKNPRANVGDMGLIPGGGGSRLPRSS